MIKKEKVEKAKELISSQRENYNYFFENINDIDWIKALKEEGYFTSPFNAIRSENGVRFPIWPESRTLIRFAEEYPQYVSKLVREIEDTDNERVHEDYLKIAIQILPDENALEIINDEIKWIKKTDYLYLNYTDKAGKVIIKLAESGYIDKAIEFSRSLLEIREDVTEVDNKLFGDSFREAIPAKVENWNFQELIRKYVIELVQFESLRVLNLICDILLKALRLGKDNPNDPNGLDYSYIWRGYIGENPEYGTDLYNSLTNYVRDICLKLFDDQPDEVVKCLRDYDYQIFKRVELYIRDQKFGIDIEGTNEVLKDEEIIDSKYYYAELRKLLRNHYSELDESTQSYYLDFIQSGISDKEAWLENYNEIHDTNFEIDFAEKTERKFQYQKLVPIRKYLKGDWRARFDALNDEFGPPDDSDLVVKTESGVPAFDLPLTNDDLDKFSVKEIVEYLDSWEPTNQYSHRPKEGMQRLLANNIGSNWEKYLADIELFRKIKVEYFVSLADGIRGKIENEENIEFSDETWDLLIWITEIATNRDKGQDEYYDLQSCNRSMSFMVNKLVQTQKYASLIKNNYKELFKLLSILLKDENPTPEREREANKNSDLISLGINSTRSVAIEAFIRLCYKLVQEYGLDEKEVKSINDQTYDTIIESLDESSSLTNYTMIGRNLPYLMDQNEEKFKKHVDLIIGRECDIYRTTTISAYIDYFPRPHVWYYEILESDYNYLLENWNTETVKTSYSLEQGIAQHIALLYINSDLSERTLSLFLEYGPLNSKLTVLRLFGDYLQYPDLEEKQSELIRIYWEKRSKNKNEISKNELAYFSYLFPSQKIDREWALSELLETVLIANKIENSDEVFRKLKNDFSEYPVLVLKCIKAINVYDEYGYYVYGNKNIIHSILDRAKKIKGDEVKRCTEKLVNSLISKGHHEFKS